MALTRAMIAVVQVLVAQHFGIRTDVLRQRGRTPAVVLCRNAAIWLARALTGASYPELGQRFGGMDHSTMMWACRRMREEMAADPVLRETILGLRDQIAVNIPDVPGVARGMHLTFQPAPPRLTVEVRGEQPFELPAAIRLGAEGPASYDLGTCRGPVWVRVPDAARKAWERVCGAHWHDLSIEVAPDDFRGGRILLTAGAGEEPPPEVLLQLEGEGMVEAVSALVEFGATA